MTDHTTIEGKATEIESNTVETPKTDAVTPRAKPRRGLLVGAVAVPLALGAVGFSLAQPAQTPLTPVAPVAVSALQPSGAIAAKGEVAEIFGNKFILQDGTGRALVETGRAGEGGTLVAKGESVTVQGRFENGFLHASVLTRADGKTEPLRPVGPPPAASTGRRTRPVWGRPSTSRPSPRRSPMPATRMCASPVAAPATSTWRPRGRTARSGCSMSASTGRSGRSGCSEY